MYHLAEGMKNIPKGITTIKLSLSRNDIGLTPKNFESFDSVIKNLPSELLELELDLS